MNILDKLKSEPVVAGFITNEVVQVFAKNGVNLHGNALTALSAGAACLAALIVRRLVSPAVNLVEGAA